MYLEDLQKYEAFTLYVPDSLGVSSAIAVKIADGMASVVAVSKSCLAVTVLADWLNLRVSSVRKLIMSTMPVFGNYYSLKDAENHAIAIFVDERRKTEPAIYLGIIFGFIRAMSLTVNNVSLMDSSLFNSILVKFTSGTIRIPSIPDEVRNTNPEIRFIIRDDFTKCPHYLLYLATCHSIRGVRLSHKRYGVNAMVVVLNTIFRELLPSQQKTILGEGDVNEKLVFKEGQELKLPDQQNSEEAGV